MPWKEDKFGEYKYYVTSIYTKEELPTWGEVYYDFYKNNIFFYDPNNEKHQVNDLYWKIPKRKYILAIICNQFNKMLFEDGMRNKLLDLLKDDNVVDLRFSIQSIKSMNNIDKISREFNMETNMAPPIYTIPLPSGVKNPFIINAFKRINVKDLKGFLSLYLWIVFKYNNEESKLLELSSLNENTNQILYDKIIELIMQPFIEYFEGEGVGWKDEYGNLIDSEPGNNSCNGVGYDPAL